MAQDVRFTALFKHFVQYSQSNIPLQQHSSGMDYTWNAWNRACIHIILMTLYFKGADSQNAYLTAIPETVPMGGSIILTCSYTGTQNETAVIWFNGSNSNALTLTPGSNVPECDLFSMVKLYYDPARISYTCDLERNTYTLRIDPVQPVDDNFTWSCTFSDPVPNSNKAEFTIRLGVPAIDSSRDANKINSEVIIAVIVILGIVSVMGVTLLIFVCRRKKRWPPWNNGADLGKAPRETRTTSQESIPLTKTN